MATEDKSIKRRRGTEAALKATGQLIGGQAGFCSDKKKILFKRPATWASPGTIDEYDFLEIDYSQSCCPCNLFKNPFYIKNVVGYEIKR